MKLYIITIDEVFDFEGYSHKPIVKLTKKEAQEELKALKKDAKEELGKELNKCSTSKNSFSMYPDGEWGTSHYDVTINEVEVEGIQKIKYHGKT